LTCHAKSSNGNSFWYCGLEHEGYIDGILPGNGDVCEVEVCMNCGQEQSNDYPIDHEKILNKFEQEE
jgi:hypothetical protein